MVFASKSLNMNLRYYVLSAFHGWQKLFGFSNKRILILFNAILLLQLSIFTLVKAFQNPESNKLFSSLSHSKQSNHFRTVSTKTYVPSFPNQQKNFSVAVCRHYFSRLWKNEFFADICCCEVVFCFLCMTRDITSKFSKSFVCM